MAISTNSIIHYTNSFEILKSILEEGFRIKYCTEVLRLLENDGSRAAHPMISFCDIPLSNSTQHFNAYGRYGIGLSKNWAIENGVNPVLYIDRKSLFAKSLSQLLVQRRNKLSNLTQEQKDDILKIKAYAKNYSGHLKREKIDNPNYKFYDEREWRLVPDRSQMNNAQFSVNLASFKKDIDKYNGKISDCRFKFVPKDISYIIVDKTEEIPGLIKFLRNSFEERCNSKELDILVSKICSTEQIKDDY